MDTKTASSTSSPPARMHATNTIPSHSSSCDSWSSISRAICGHRPVIQIETLWHRRLQWTIRTCISVFVASILCMNPVTRPFFAVPYMVPVFAVFGSYKNFGGTAQYCYQILVGALYGSFTGWLTITLFPHSDEGRCVFWWVTSFVGAFLQIHSKCPPLQTKVFLGVNTTATCRFIRLPATAPSFAFHMLLDVVIGVACSLAPMMIPPRSTVRLAVDRLAYAARLNTIAFRSVVEGFLCTNASRSQIFHVRSLKTLKSVEENMESVRSLIRESTWMPRRPGILDQLTQRLKVLEWQRVSLLALAHGLQVGGSAPMTFSATHNVVIDYLRQPLMDLGDASEAFMKRYFNLHNDDDRVPSRDAVTMALKNVHQQWLTARIRVFYPPQGFAAVDFTTGDALAHHTWLFNIDNYVQPLCFPDAPNNSFVEAVHHAPHLADFHREPGMPPLPLPSVPSLPHITAGTFVRTDLPSPLPSSVASSPSLLTPISSLSSLPVLPSSLRDEYELPRHSHSPASGGSGSNGDVVASLLTPSLCISPSPSAPSSPRMGIVCMPSKPHGHGMVYSTETVPPRPPYIDCDEIVHDIINWFRVTFRPFTSTKPSDYRKSVSEAFRIAAALIISGLLVIVPKYRVYVESGSFAPNTVAYLYSGTLGSGFQTSLQRLWGTVTGVIWAYLVLLLSHSESVQMVAGASVFSLVSSYIRSNKSWSYTGLVAGFICMSVMFGYDPKGVVAIADYALNRIAQTTFGIVTYLLLEASFLPSRASTLARSQLINVLTISQKFCIDRWVVRDDELNGPAKSLATPLPLSPLDRPAPPPAAPARWCASYGMEMGGSRAALKAAIATHELLLPQAVSEPELWHPVFALQLYQRIILCERNMMRSFVDVDRAISRMSMLNGDSLPHRESLRAPFRHFFVCATRALGAFVSALKAPVVAHPHNQHGHHRHGGHHHGRTKQAIVPSSSSGALQSIPMDNTPGMTSIDVITAPAGTNAAVATTARRNSIRRHSDGDIDEVVAELTTPETPRQLPQRSSPLYESETALGRIAAANRLAEHEAAVARLAPGELLYSMHDALLEFDTVFTRWFEDHLVQTYRRHRHDMSKSSSRTNLADLPDIEESLDPSSLPPSISLSTPSRPLGMLRASASNSSRLHMNMMEASPLDPTGEWSIILPTMTNIDAMTLFAICANIRTLTDELINMGHLVREVLHNDRQIHDFDSVLEYT